MRPGNRASNVPNCSAITSGAMIWQHYAARSHPDRAGAAGNIRDYNRSRGAGDARHVVMFRQPETIIAQPLDMTGKIEGVLKRLTGGSCFRNGRKIAEPRKGIMATSQ